MLEIRLFEEALAKVYSQGKVRCPVHLAIGHEAAAVGVCAHLKESDIVFGYHRSHHHFLSAGGSTQDLLDELLGLETGCSKGHGGSTHLIDLSKNFWGSTAIISGTIPVATGAAHALKFKSKNNLVVCFVGDAAIEEGVFFESLNISSLWNLPILFVVEDNNLSCYTNKKSRHGFLDLKYLAKFFRLSFDNVDGSDLALVNRSAKKLLASTRKKSRPSLLKIDVFRAHEHCGPDQDSHLHYRSVKGRWPKMDPIKKSKDVIGNKLFQSLNEEAKIKVIKLFRARQINLV